MAASTATSGFGTLLKVGDGASPTEAFTTILEVKSINGPTLQAGIAESTHMESPSNTREFLPTLIDPGEVSFDANFLPAATTQDGLFDDLAARTQRNWQLVWTDTAPTTYSFAGYVTGFQPRAEMEGPLTVSITIKLTSYPVAS